MLELTESERKATKLALELALNSGLLSVSKRGYNALERAYLKIKDKPCPNCNGLGEVPQNAWTDDMINCYCTHKTLKV